MYATQVSPSKVHRSAEAPVFPDPPQHAELLPQVEYEFQANYLLWIEKDSLIQDPFRKGLPYE